MKSRGESVASETSIGLTFAAAMRAFVRQDPDVIMVVKCATRDASIAIHAALTGHLVLTTLHTETAAAAVPRLLDLGVEGFLLKSTLRAVIAQRLVRILCDRCKKKRILNSADIAADPAMICSVSGRTIAFMNRWLRALRRRRLSRPLRRL